MSAHATMFTVIFCLILSFLLFYFYFSHKHDECKYIDAKHHHLTPENKQIIDLYKIDFFCSSKFFLVITLLFIDRFFSNLF